jgi:hypothetical protein
MYHIWRVIMPESTIVNKPKIICVNDFGILPDSGEDAISAVRSAISAAFEEKGPVVLQFKKGRYDFYSENSTRVPYYISNTASEDENPDLTKNIGLYIKGIKNLTIEGNGSQLVFHGKMTTIVIDQSEDVEIRNLSIDFERPTMSEMTVEAVGADYIDFRVNSDSWYEIEGNRLVWVGEGFRYTNGPSQEYAPEKNITWRTWNPASESECAVELEPFRLRLYYSAMHKTKVGNVFQMRDGIRDQAGVFINCSKNIVFKSINFYYMHGLGIVGQYSENLHFEGLNCVPHNEKGRTAASFADFMHFSGCKGNVAVLNSHFAGSHDDCINVHGTHLRIMEKPSGNELVVRFMHPQSYGFDAFFSGDSIDFINSAALTVLGSASVISAERLSARETILKMDQNVPEDVVVGDCVENATWTPDVEIRGNCFARVPTRGILVTTRKKVVIEDNVFERMGVSGILIADDAESWYESGMISDVTIKNNVFIECADPVINISPENTDIRPENPVHRNIRIEGNRFKVRNERILYAKSTQGLSFIGNTIVLLDPDAYKSKSMIELLACSDVKVLDNTDEEEI